MESSSGAIQASDAPMNMEGARPPDISVVIATHDRPQLLRQAVSAVLEQTYRGHVEVLVVFDGTDPDDTMESETTDRRVRVLTNQRTRGLAGARNTGICEATGELVAFCDDDDEWVPEKLAVQVHELASANADTVVSGIRIAYEGHTSVRVPREQDLTLPSLARRRVMEAHPSTVVVRRDALLSSIGLIDEQLPGSYGEDFDWILRAAEHGKIAVAEAPLVRVRWGGSHFSTRWGTIVEAIDYGIAKHEVLRRYPDGLARLYGRRAFALAAMGRSSEARESARRALKLNWTERRAYLAVAVSLKVVSAERLMSWAHRRGRGI